MATVTVLEALGDNYMYLIACPDTKKAAVVDPADAEVCVKAAAAAGVTITTVLTTHHHFDHAGGNEDMKKLVPGIEVIGGERILNGLARGFFAPHALPRELDALVLKVCCRG